MSAFVKFPSIQQDWIVPAFADASFHESTFVVTEKIDGANVQLYFEKARPWRVGKRTGFVKRNQQFYNLWSVLKVHNDEIERLANYAAENHSKLRLYGELFGSDVMKRIDYRTSGDVRFFQMDVNGERLSFADMECLLGGLQLTHLLAPVLGRCLFGEALSLSSTFASLLNPEEEAEGFVVCGQDKCFKNNQGTPFLCKVKNPRFVDVEGGELDNPCYFPITRYLNRNRICSVASKHGDFNDPRMVDQYLQWVLEEVTADYQQDHGCPSEVPASTFTQQIRALIFEHVKQRRASQ